MSKIKVFNVITNGLRREGITTTQLEYAKRLASDSIDMHIADVEDHEEDVLIEFRDIGCKVISFPNRRKTPLRYTMALFTYLKKNKYDVIHVHGSSYLMGIELFVAKLAGIKTRIAHSRNTKTDHLVIHRILEPLFFLSYNEAFACGQDAGKWLFKDKPFRIIHNGKDLSKFKFDTIKRKIIRKQYNIKGEIVIGFVGNFTRQKNLEFLFEILSKLKREGVQYKAFLIGDGELRDEVLSELHSRNLEEQIVLTGRISNVNEYLCAMDIMLLPSFFEGLPNVVLEWQASGLKCLVSNQITEECSVTDMVEFLPINNGTKMWVESIKNFEKYDRESASIIGCNNLKLAKFEIEESANFIKKIYMQLC